MMRWEMLQFLIDRNKYEDYCEIGLFHSWNWNNIVCKNKTAIDPDKNIPIPQGGQFFNGTSDEFFAELPEDKKFSLFFIDGLHEAKQVEKDIKNSLNHLSPGGTIVLHDCNPPKYEHTTTGIDGCWTGDAYKAFIKFRLQYPEYETCTVNTDWGCGIIFHPPREGVYIYMTSEEIELLVEWDNFDINRYNLLNLISVEEFIQKTNERTVEGDTK